MSTRGRNVGRERVRSPPPSSAGSFASSPPRPCRSCSCQPLACPSPALLRVPGLLAMSPSRLRPHGDPLRLVALVPPERQPQHPVLHLGLHPVRIDLERQAEGAREGP